MLEEDLPALEGHRVFASRDVEETEAQISALLQPHRLRPTTISADYHANMDFFRFSSIGVGSIAYSRPMSLQLEEIADYYLLMFCRRGSARLIRNGGEEWVGRRHGVCIAPGEPLHAEFTDDCEQIVFKVDARTLCRHAGRKAPLMRQRIDLADTLFAPWRTFVRGMLSDPATVDFATSNTRVAAEYESLFLSTLLQGGLVDNGRADSGIAPISVKRAEAYIDDHFADPITLDDIAAAAGVPARTLLNGFRRFRDTSPIRALRERRLTAAHERLLAAESDQSILDIALDVGFGHPGRFALAYTERFGEKPSTTLRRRRLTNLPTHRQ
ncbi:AraC family transcriptional regulator [Rhizorhabdus wittichii DC-6]|uniref:Transcriptional regulator, AraC family n=1 Tax=Rhizorhabdus wittichii (strain DSM 6014 / CCUG 31198 / JCM 15750 / NBRC 105917 / EY 4224 / RW1) TaxID=392499 RepID=A0A9J9HB83_RHIWR|nr:AraC family transcriptional regulator [Rhizorhabdus wittichii]ABQ68398.1 transcriptional regulator, AraC family [Rhizorhabdus wittichii RW1]ARR54705.1 AraC family transcriptional regulator [Rhizorhabdus wittichii DC-6]